MFTFLVNDVSVTEASQEKEKMSFLTSMVLLLLQ